MRTREEIDVEMRARAAKLGADENKGWRNAIRLVGDVAYSLEQRRRCIYCFAPMEHHPPVRTSDIEHYQSVIRQLKAMRYA